jgi:hypothetical protein
MRRAHKYPRQALIDNLAGNLTRHKHLHACITPPGWCNFTATASTSKSRNSARREAVGINAYPPRESHAGLHRHDPLGDPEASNEPVPEPSWITPRRPSKSCWKRCIRSICATLASWGPQMQQCQPNTQHGARRQHHQPHYAKPKQHTTIIHTCPSCLHRHNDDHAITSSSASATCHPRTSASTTTCSRLGQSIRIP